MAEQLAAGSVAIALPANTIATGAALVALILTFGPVSGGHFNPAVSLADSSEGGLSLRTACAYSTAQFAGALAGVICAHAMFGESVLAPSQQARSGGGQLLSEFVATFGLLSVIWGCSRTRPAFLPFAVGAYITAAYWFTASTSFANPALTVARGFTDTFAGVRLVDVPAFLAAQAGGAGRDCAVPLALAARPSGWTTRGCHGTCLMAKSRPRLVSTLHGLRQRSALNDIGNMRNDN